MLKIVSNGFPRIPTVLCIFLLLLSGCRQSALVRSQRPDSRNAYGPASPGNLSSYIRTVLKISAEKGPRVEQELKRAEEQNPELRKQAEESSANPGDVEAGLDVANAYLKAGLYYPAYEVYQRLRAAVEPRAEIELGLAEVWDKWRDYSLARTHVGYALELKPQSPEAWHVLGRIELHRGDLRAAATSLEKAVVLGVSDPLLFANAGYAFLRLDRLDKAQDYLEKALALDATIEEAHNHLGIVLARRGHPDLALAHFKQTSESAVALNNLGAVYLEQGRGEAAQRYFREALSLRPGYEKARANLREVDSLVPPPVRVSVGVAAVSAPAETSPAARPESQDVSSATAPPVAPETRTSVRKDADSFEPLPMRVSVSIASTLPFAPARLAQDSANSGVILDSKARLQAELQMAHLAPAKMTGGFYQPALLASLRSVALRATAVDIPHHAAPVPGGDPYASQALSRHPRPVAANLSRPGASLSVTALRWQEPLLDPVSMTDKSVDWSLSPQGELPSKLFVPSLTNLLLPSFVTLGVLVGLLLAGSAGAILGIGLALVAVLAAVVSF